MTVIIILRGNFTYMELMQKIQLYKINEVDHLKNSANMNTIKKVVINGVMNDK